jgi:hypothetical protein
VCVCVRERERERRKSSEGEGDIIIIRSFVITYFWSLDKKLTSDRVIISLLCRDLPPPLNVFHSLEYNTFSNIF